MKDNSNYKIPYVIKLAPPRLRPWLAMRFYRDPEKYHHLYDNAPLYLNKKVLMKLHPGDVMSDMVALTGMFEHKKSRRIVNLAKNGGTMVDVGANLGFFSLLWASFNNDNRVFSFEPSPRNIQYLQHNIDKNNFGNQIIIFKNALGSDNGVMEFDPGNVDQTGWGGFTLQKNSRSITVNVKRLDDYAPEIKKIDLLKIDTEGADYLVLKGAKEMLSAKIIKEIWFEQNKPRASALGISIDASQEYLKSCDYKIYPEGDTNCDLVDWRAVPR